MQIFSHHAVGLQQGSSLMFSAFEDGGPIVVGQWRVEQVRRICRLHTQVSADAGGSGAPSACGTLTATATSGPRSAPKTSPPAAFDLVFSTWGDTRVARIRADWIAIGALPHEDDFRVWRGPSACGFHSVRGDTGYPPGSTRFYRRTLRMHKMIALVGAVLISLGQGAGHPCARGAAAGRRTRDQFDRISRPADEIRHRRDIRSLSRSQRVIAAIVEYDRPIRNAGLAHDSILR